MKKIFIASAMVMLGASAFAQSGSSVTLSGVVDAGIENAGGSAETSVTSGRDKSSQITFSGKESLGTGLNATFKIGTDTGSVQGIGNNDMYVGLEGDLGKLRIGRSFDPVYSHALTANGTKGVTGYQTLGTALSDRGIRVSNQVMYITPVFYGLTATASYGAAEANGSRDALGLGVRYVQGPIEATYAASRSAGVNSKYVHQVAGAYDFRIARVSLTVQEDNNLNQDKHAYSLGVTGPVGPGLLWASYDIRQIAGNDNGQVVQAGYKYSMSRRTTVYAQVGFKNSAFNGNSSKGIGAGIAHSF